MTHTSVWRAMRPRGKAALVLAAAVVAMTGLPLLAPQVTLRFVDDAIAGAGTAQLTMLAASYLGLALAGQLARTVTSWLANRLAWDGTNRLREQAAAHALSLDMGYHGRRTPGEMIERVDGDVAAVADFAVAFLLDVVASVLLLGGVIAVVFTVDWRIGAALTLYCGVAFLVMTWAQKLAVPSGTVARAANATLMGDLEEHLTGIEDIRANGAGEHIVREFHRTSRALNRAEFLGARVGTTLLAGTWVAFATGTALILGLAAWLRFTDQLTLGTAVLLFQYTLMIRAPFERLIEQLRHLQAALSGIARLRDLLSQPRPLPEPVRAVALPFGPLEVALQAVSFAYSPTDRPALSEVTLTLAPGETLGLVGRTGSGKSTLGRLLLRLYDPTTGAVRVGGHDLRTVSEESLRERIGVVTQDVQLFQASVRDNLTLFRSEPEDRTLLRVLDDVGLGDWLAARPDGLDSPLGNLSAGEAQLLAFARALLADPGLIVLDEPSSRLDPVTERRIEQCVDRLFADRTGILIAHRLSSLSRVDTIAVLSDGRIVEYGPRAALTADPGSRFARMLQLAAAHT